MGDCVRLLSPFVQSLALSTGSKSAYSDHLRTLQLACESLRLDPLALTADDLCCVVLWFALSRSIHSIDAFLSALSHLYISNNLSLPRSLELKSLRRGLSRLFNVPDAPARAYPLSKREVKALLSALNASDPSHVVFASWLSASFMFALRPEDLERLRWCDVTFFSDGGMDVTVLPGKGAAFHGKSIFSAPPSSSCLNPAVWFRRLASFPLSFNTKELCLRVVDSKSKKFLSPIRRSTFANLLNDVYLCVFNVSPPQRLTAYSLRRGGSSALYDAGVKEAYLAKHMRHSSFSATVPYVDSTASLTARRNTSSHIVT